MRATKEAVRSIRNPELTRQRILDAAMQEFAAHGFAGARVDLIAQKARINKRMLYHYFGDKEALFRQILRVKITARRAWMASAPQHPLRSLPYWSELMGQDPDWIRLLQWEALHWGEKKSLVDEARRREGFQKAVTRIREQQAAGEISSELEAGQLLISVLALSAYPFAFPQLARLITGLRVSSPEFRKQREEFLRRLGGCLETAATAGPRAPCSTS